MKKTGELFNMVAKASRFDIGNIKTVGESQRTLFLDFWLKRYCLRIKKKATNTNMTMISKPSI